jgi:dephospho-CoA kinase
MTPIGRPRGRRPVRIGLTGPIGCGKSTIAGWLAELGAVVIYADRVARDVTPAGSAELAAVERAFGPSVIGSDGSLDRAALARIVFADPAALSRLEAIVHPAVRPRILAMMAAAERDGAPGVVIEAIKLVEGGLAQLCDEVWLVTCTLAVQRERLIGRGANAADADARIAAQTDLAMRLAPRATRIIDTAGPAEETRALVRVAWDEATASDLLRGSIQDQPR